MRPQELLSIFNLNRIVTLAALFTLPNYTVGNSFVKEGYLLHIVSAANTKDWITLIEHPYANYQPEAILVVSKIFNLPKEFEAGNVAVDYAAGKWYIYFNDCRTIPMGLELLVAVRQTSTLSVFTLTYESDSTIKSSQRIAIDNKNAYGNPFAQIYITGMGWDDPELTKCFFYLEYKDETWWIISYVTNIKLPKTIKFTIQILCKEDKIHDNPYIYLQENEIIREALS